MPRESAWSRAKKDTGHFRESAKSYWFMEIVGAAMFGVGGGFGGYWLTPLAATKTEQFAYPTIGGAIGVILGFAIVFGFIFAWHLFRASYRQRDEAILALETIENEAASSEVVRVTEKLKTFRVSIAGIQLDAATILQDIWGKLAVGSPDYEIVGSVGKDLGLENAGTELFDATKLVLAELSVYRIVETEQRLMASRHRSSYQQVHWKRTDFGAEVMQHLESEKKQASRMEGSQS